MERVEWISIMHKQNLNGRETEDELFEAGILAGIEETEEIMYTEEDMRKAIQETITLMRYKATEFREHENTVIKKFKTK